MRLKRIHIRRDDSILVKINGSFISCDNGVHSFDMDADCYVEAYPQGNLPHLFRLSAAARITEKDGTLLSSSNDIRFIPYGKDDCEIRFALPVYRNNIKSEAILQDNFKAGGYIHSLCVYRDSGKYILLEHEDIVFHYPLDDSTEDIEAGTLKLNNGEYIAVKGTFGGKNQLILIGYDYNYKMLIDITADRITLSDKIETLTLHNDMTGRERRDVYTVTNNSVTVQSFFTYTRSLQYHARLYPYLLLEAIQAKDYGSAKDYLAYDIRESASEIADYLGAFTSIEYPRYGEFNENIIALRYEDGAVKLYSLDFEGELVGNISEYVH